MKTLQLKCAIRVLRRLRQIAIHVDDACNEVESIVDALNEEFPWGLTEDHMQAIEREILVVRDLIKNLVAERSKM